LAVPLTPLTLLAPVLITPTLHLARHTDAWDMHERAREGRHAALDTDVTDVLRSQLILRCISSAPNHVQET